MKRTIKFRRKRLNPEYDIYDQITASHYYATISEHELLKAAFEVAREHGASVVQFKIRDENAFLRSKIVFEVSEQEHPWFDIVDGFLGRMSKFIEKVQWW